MSSVLAENSADNYAMTGAQPDLSDQGHQQQQQQQQHQLQQQQQQQQHHEQQTGASQTGCLADAGQKSLGLTEGQIEQHCDRQQQQPAVVDMATCEGSQSAETSCQKQLGKQTCESGGQTKTDGHVCKRPKLDTAGCQQPTGLGSLATVGPPAAPVDDRSAGQLAAPSDASENNQPPSGPNQNETKRRIDNVDDDQGDDDHTLDYGPILSKILDEKKLALFRNPNVALLLRDLQMDLRRNSQTSTVEPNYPRYDHHQQN